MSAIFGAIASDRSAPVTADLAAMGAASHEWGESPRTWTAGAAGLGCVIGRTVPEAAAERQPCVDPSAPEVVLVADARLDDRAGLCRRLSTPDDGRSDSSLILKAYLAWGEDGIRGLVGAFALAIWDGRTGTLVCARDHIGMRPLFHRSGGGRFLFATDARAILACHGVAREVDETAVVANLVEHHGLLRERSFFRGLDKLAPGQVLTLRRGDEHPRRRTYWEPAPRPTVRLPSRTGYAAALRESLEVATEAAVRSPSPVVAHLSGGLDSSAVAAIAQRRLRSRGEGLAAGISYSPPARVPGNDDERGRVLRLAEHLGVELQWTELTAAALQADFERDAALLPNASAVYEYLVLPGLVERGAGVVLSGWGGDEVASYSGYGHIGRLLRAGRWGTLWRDGAAIARRRGRTGARVPVSVAAQVATPVIRSVMPDRARPLFKLPPAELFDDPAAWTGVHPAAPDLRRDALRSMPAGGSPADRQAALLRHGHVTARLESWAYVGARFGVEYRFPLLDRRVIDLCLSFPPEVWVGEGYNRWVFRKAIEPDLPREVVWGDPKWEPARVANYRSLALEGWEPQVRDSMPDTAALLVRYRALLREHLRTGPTY